MKLLMKRPLLLLLNLIPILLFAQQPVIFPDDFKTSALNGKEVTITNTLTLTNNYSYTYGTLTFSNGQLWTPTEKFEPVQSEEPGEPEKPTHRKARLLPYRRCRRNLPHRTNHRRADRKSQLQQRHIHHHPDPETRIQRQRTPHLLRHPGNVQLESGQLQPGTLRQKRKHL